MTTTQQDKPGGKPRQRPRKADRRGPKTEQPVSTAADQLNQDQMADTIRDQMAETAQDQAADIAAPVEAPAVSVAAATAVNGAAAAALSGEVLLPQIRQNSAVQPINMIGFQAIGQAYADYTRNSWLAGRSLAERFMTTRSFGEAIEAQSEFAKQAYVNFVVHSQKIGGLYGEFARQFFRPRSIGR